MKKCDLVCGNCHSIRTHNRRIKTLKIKTIKDELTKEYDVSEEEG
jgi:predicted HNH restriction endonuclease